MLNRILTLILLAMVGMSGVALGSDAKRPPNFVLLLCDDVAYDDIGCYGATKIKTPHIDALAKEGRRFTSYYAPGSVCTPTRAAIMTGCYAPRVGLPAVLYPQANIGLNADEVTLPEILKSKGYATACIGKWHLGHQAEFNPVRHGFDYFYGIPYPNDHGPERTKRNNPPIPLYRNEEVIEAPVDLPSLGDRFVAESRKFLEANKDKPFFLYVPFVGAHTPWYVADRFKGTSELGPYGDAVQELDANVGAIMQTLKDLKIDENTLVIFASDNGPLFRPHEELAAVYGPAGTLLPQTHVLREGKYTSAEGGVRVPMIARWPKAVPAGSESNEMIAGFDLLPTFARLAEAAVPTDRIIDGKDALALLTQNDAKTPHDRFYYFANYNLEAVRSGEWKLRLIEHELPHDGSPAKKGISLYNLSKDLGETTNLAAEHPEIVARLQALLEEARADIGDGKNNPGKNRRAPGKVGNDPARPG